ncbi:winged helix-turn-helix transcriptional regulator [Sulfurisphaera ohwakuensis]|uniref:Winged helix-turn-helix transcriptional regulator n=2 Tax=Sulfurisphaera ohwakuensis TaxID=69656 RepID=A0A650CE17_SULOH|nr:winged helix-turn-helix transcriptional regulator [Sulfurisphaera ohwakuensis]
MYKENKNVNMSQNIDDIVSKIGNIARAFGITRNELKLYFLLLLNGKMTAKELSDKVNISYTKIYPILTKLEGRGWIRRIGKRPSYYVANPIREVWENVKKNISDALDKVERELILPISVLLSSQTSFYNIALVQQDNIAQTLKQILAENSSKYYVAISFKELISDDLIKILEANSYKYDVRVILTKNINIESNVLNIKYLDSMFGSGIITSNSIFLIIKTQGNMLLGMFSNHIYFVEIGKVYFEYLWEKADKSKE